MGNFAGVDWAAEKHDVLVAGPAGEARRSRTMSRGYGRCAARSWILARAGFRASGGKSDRFDALDQQPSGQSGSAPKTTARFDCGGKHPAQLVSKLRRAPVGCVGEAELTARRALVLALVAALKTLQGEIFTSLFRGPHSVICAATLLGEIGDCGARYPTREALAGDAGQAAIAIQSGKRTAACFRWACNKRLRCAFGTLADSTRQWYPWAQDRYAAARARGQDHPRAIRTLGRAWCRIVWRCWQDRVPYDPARHRGLQQHITVTIPTASEPVVDQAATERIAAGAFATNAITATLPPTGPVVHQAATERIAAGAYATNADNPTGLTTTEVTAAQQLHAPGAHLQRHTISFGYLSGLPQTPASAVDVDRFSRTAVTGAIGASRFAPAEPPGRL